MPRLNQAARGKDCANPTGWVCRSQTLQAVYLGGGVFLSRHQVGPAAPMSSQCLWQAPHPLLYAPQACLVLLASQVLQFFFLMNQEEKTIHQQKDFDSLYRNTHYIVVVWNQTCSPSEVCLFLEVQLPNHLEARRALQSGRRELGTPALHLQLCPDISAY